MKNLAKVSVENQKNKAERLTEQKTNVVWNSQTLKREARDKREAKRRKWFKPQQSQLSPSATAFPQKREQETDGDGGMARTIGRTFREE